MNVAELNGSHVGRKLTVTLTERDVVVTGVLSGVHHAAGAITELTFDGKTTTSIGRRYTVLTFLHAGEFRVSGAATVEVFPGGS